MIIKIDRPSPVIHEIVIHHFEEDKHIPHCICGWQISTATSLFAAELLADVHIVEQDIKDSGVKHDY